MVVTDLDGAESGFGAPDVSVTGNSTSAADGTEGSGTVAGGAGSAGILSNAG